MPLRKASRRYNSGTVVSTSPTAVTLVRQLGVVSATALVVSNMIGTGIFTTSGFLAGQLGDPTLFLLIWLVGAVGGTLRIVLLLRTGS